MADERPPRRSGGKGGPAGKGGPRGSGGFGGKGRPAGKGGPAGKRGRSAAVGTRRSGRARGRTAAAAGTGRARPRSVCPGRGRCGTWRPAAVPVTGGRARAVPDRPRSGGGPGQSFGGRSAGGWNRQGGSGGRGRPGGSRGGFGFRADEPTPTDDDARPRQAGGFDRRSADFGAPGPRRPGEFRAGPRPPFDPASRQFRGPGPGPRPPRGPGRSATGRVRGRRAGRRFAIRHRVRGRSLVIGPGRIGRRATSPDREGRAVGRADRPGGRRPAPAGRRSCAAPSSRAPSSPARPNGARSSRGRFDARPVEPRSSVEEQLREGEELVAGRRPVEEAFVARRPALRLLVVPNRRQALEKIVLHATSLRIPIVEIEGGSLTAVAGFDGHQGVALVVRPRAWATVDDVLARAAERGEPPFVLALDSLEDPQNVGTLLRSAEAVGAHGVLFPTHRQAPLSPAAIKASAGATEHLLLVPVDDLPGTLADLHVRGLRVAGADEDAPLTARQADLRGPIALVVGSEGQGLGPAVRRRTDLLVKIPMRGAIGSLNAAVAGSILLFDILAQRLDDLPPRRTGSLVRLDRGGAAGRGSRAQQRLPTRTRRRPRRRSPESPRDDDSTRSRRRPTTRLPPAMPPKRRRGNARGPGRQPSRPRKRVGPLPKPSSTSRAHADATAAEAADARRTGRSERDRRCAEEPREDKPPRPPKRRRLRKPPNRPNPRRPRHPNRPRRRGPERANRLPLPPPDDDLLPGGPPVPEPPPDPSDLA